MIDFFAGAYGNVQNIFPRRQRTSKGIIVSAIRVVCQVKIKLYRIAAGSLSHIQVTARTICFAGTRLVAETKEQLAAERTHIGNFKNEQPVDHTVKLELGLGIFDVSLLFPIVRCKNNGLLLLDGLKICNDAVFHVGRKIFQPRIFIAVRCKGRLGRSAHEPILLFPIFPDLFGVSGLILTALQRVKDRDAQNGYHEDQNYVPGFHGSIFPDSTGDKLYNIMSRYLRILFQDIPELHSWRVVRCHPLLCELFILPI